MNQAQRAYNSYDKTSIMLKANENLYHQRNLMLIKNRKSQYSSKPPKGIHNKKEDLSKFFFILKQCVSSKFKKKINFYFQVSSFQILFYYMA